MLLRAVIIAIIGGAPALELTRDIDIDDAAHYRVTNRTARTLYFHHATIQLAKRNSDGGMSPLPDRSCEVRGKSLPAGASLDLGQWDELCFGGGYGNYRARLTMREADGGLGPVGEAEFFLASDRHTHVLRPYPRYALRREHGELITTSNGATACVCDETSVGLSNTPMSPLGDYPLPED